MNIYYVKVLLFTFLINTLLLPQYENFINNHYNVSFIPNNTQISTIKSRLLAQTQKHNPHYHNDPELKEIIDKLNNEAIKKYLQTHDPYKQLQELVEKNGTKLTGGNNAEPISTTDKELLETHEDVLDEENDIMLKSDMYPNDDEKSDKSSTCECTDINNAKLATTKGKDKYLKQLKERCKGGIRFCSIGSIILIFIGKYASYVIILNIFNETSMITTIQAGANATVCGLSDILTPAAASDSAIFGGCGIASLVLIILAVVLIILYIWLYRRKKNSWKHEYKKHLCK
ncbi:stevor PIR protein, putative [Plasmodium reichenowi]|uniref:Stevor PIR protein, putative n=1 Tax=Plasmodium reichenowi TaxID=5854 RepID=A0A2P9D213_PLARE|nr:stevor PIR protein, putative [Plasmodium reichenowi]